MKKQNLFANSHINNASAHAWYVELELMLVELTILRPDLKYDLIETEVMKIVNKSSDTILNILQSFIDNARADEPMPWEKINIKGQ